MTALRGICFDVSPGINSGVEVEAILQFSSLAIGQAEETAKAEASELIRRQVFGPIEDAIKAEMEEWTSDSIRKSFEKLLALTRTNSN